jgi:putative phosphoribosyl transferase
MTLWTTELLPFLSRRDRFQISESSMIQKLRIHWNIKKQSYITFHIPFVSTVKNMSTNIEHRPVRILISNNVAIDGDLRIPIGGAAICNGIVLFAHGSGSSRFSPRNQFVAQELNKAGLATLLVDLLTSEEERIDNVTRHLRFDINMLADRLVDISKWIRTQENLRNMNIGLFGASTGGGAAIVAASKFDIAAVVSRGGRPDLASPQALNKITCPTLLIVGGLDREVIKMNQDAFKQLVNVKEKSLVIVPGATHLFEEEGKLQEVARLTAEWFKKYLNVQTTRVSTESSRVDLK